MAVTGDYFEAELLPVHLNWGTTSRNGQRNRHPDEVYIPIFIDVARNLDLFNDGTEFAVQGQNFNVKATGTQGLNSDYGKNLTSANGLKPLGRYLKGQLNAHPGDIVRVEWITNTEVSITIV
ncbi:phospholipase D-like domain-containing protein [Clostridium butyricum]|uniref:hypothetical protein n=1 Tax=Clostridium butyricum TaxID=1492 RepID=UPI002ABD3AA4|nr:hypothetical protein [Clostridium butyricum]